METSFHYVTITVEPLLRLTLTFERFSLLQEADFETLGGQRNVRLDRLAAGANHSHVLVVRPLRAGYFNFTAAEVKYRPSEEVEQIQLGFSSNPGQALIIELKDYEKQFSAHMVRFQN